MSFTSLGLSKSLLKELENQNYTQPTPIQTEAIPAILNRKDVLGIAKTGSGKTASFALPILMNLQGAEILKNRHVHVLVLVPTRISDFLRYSSHRALGLGVTANICNSLSYCASSNALSSAIDDEKIVNNKIVFIILVIVFI